MNAVACNCELFVITYHLQVIIYKTFWKITGCPKVNQVESPRRIIVEKIAPIRISLDQMSEKNNNKLYATQRKGSLHCIGFKHASNNHLMEFY